MFLLGIPKEQLVFALDVKQFFEYLLNNTWNLGLNVKYKSENKHDFSEEINNNKGHKR